MASPAAIKKKRSDFEFGKLLGEGSYSTVVLAKEINTNMEYAVKILVKQHVIREKKVKYVAREKEILAMTNHPLIVKLFFTFQDKENLYYGLSVANKGTLLPYIIKLGAFDEECTRFYTAEVIVVLEYLHSFGIIHRDIKPENILIGDDMHIKLTDFGTAKILNKTDDNAPKKNSFVGTAQYVSPELLTEKVSKPSSDLWALGCLVYQLRSGRPPFVDSNEYLIFKKIIKLDYIFPDGFPDKEKDLVTKLLVLDPCNRLGCEETGGYENLKRHPFYEGIDFENIHKEKPPKLQIFLPSNVPGQPGIYEEVDISKFMEDDSGLDWAIDQLNVSSVKNKEKTKKEENETTVWDQFIDGHKVIKMGIIDKRKGLFSKRRQFLLTDGPELYYVDPQAMVLKGKIPWTKELKPEAKNFRIFFVHTPHRTYYLEDPESNAIEWVKTIEEVHSRYFSTNQT